MIPSNNQDTLGSPLLDRCWENLRKLPKRKVSDYLDEVLFEFHCYGISPKNYYSKINFDFVLKILSDGNLCSQRGIQMFVMHLRWDNKLFTYKQRAALLDCFVENYHLYSGEDIRQNISEFILKCNPPEVALQTYERINEKHRSPFLEGLWWGTRKIVEKSEKGSPLWGRAMSLYLKVQARETEIRDMIQGVSVQGFENILFKESYVLKIINFEGNISFGLKMALTKNHSLYHPPNKEKQYCYKKGIIHFENILSVNWFKESTRKYMDQEGSVARGNIDVFSFSAGKYHLEGEWGEVEIHSPPPILTWI